jgi:formylglycine-generating enzyme required for sulfatase activity
MGSPANELTLEEDDKANGDETPQHTVTISKPFYLGKYPVTQAEYVQLTSRENPSWFRDRGAGADEVKGMNTNRYPVETISWVDAASCAEALQKKLPSHWGKVRLPSEAMWEYACRAGTITRWHVGNRLTDAEANFHCGLNRTCAVGCGASNAFGLFDMHGNVWQWCSDWYGKYTNDSRTDPEGPNAGTTRAARGGAWLSLAGDCRSATRESAPPSSHYTGLGLRLALVVPAENRK